MENSPKRTEVLVGFFVFLGLALLGTLIMQFGRFTDRFRGVYKVTVSFEDASGLIKGSQVRMAGAKVGQVVGEPQLTPEGTIVVEIGIRDDTPKLDKNTSFQIASLSILGDKAITITPPPPEERAGKYLEDGDHVHGGEPGGLDALQSDAQAIAMDVAAFFSEGRETLDKVDGALEELQTAAGKLSSSIDRINTGLLSEENVENVSGAIADLRGTTANIKEASGEFQPLLVDAKRAIASFDQAAEAAQGTFAQASSEISKLGPALERVPAAVDSLAGVADDARETLQSVQSSDGLLGTLAYDREVKNDAKDFLRNLRQYGILRYRDESTFDERDPRNRFRGRRR